MQLNGCVNTQKVKMTMINKYEVMYKKLKKLGILDVKEHKELKSGAFMDLSIDRLSEDRYAIAHNYVQRGDLIADPDMEIRINHKYKWAEALTYQDCFGYRRVYPEKGMVDLKAKKELNIFLNKWLTNLINQGFGKKNK